MGWSYPNNWQPLPYFCLTLPVRTSRGLHEHSEVAGLRRRWRRPARLCESQKQQPIHLLNSFVFGPRAPGVGQRPSAQARRP